MSDPTPGPTEPAPSRAELAAAFGLTVGSTPVVQDPRQVPPTSSGLATASLCVSALVALLQVVGAVCAVLIAREFESGGDYGSASPLVILANAAAGALGGVALLAAWILSGVWLMQAQQTAEVLDRFAVRRLRGGWCVGAWVVPVAGLWLPFEIVKGLRSSAGKVPTGLLGGWWASYLSCIALYWLTAIQVHATSSGDSAAALTILSVLRIVALLVALVLWLVIVLGVLAGQDDQIDRLHRRLARPS